jgi:hypothetical protein
MGPLHASALRSWAAILLLAWLAAPARANDTSGSARIHEEV